MSRISQSQLESYLWGAAEHLRGSIDAGDYKQFIFPLLFLKRLCDVHDEETTQALRASGGDAEFASFAENHRFQVPAEAHWKEIRKETRNVGQAIQRAMRAIESANKDKLFGIFGDAQWTNKDRLSDETMRELVEHFSSLDLTIANLPEDELGQGYEFLIKKFADDSGHTAAEFYTNRTVVHLMTEMLDVQPGESVYDPTCGSGGMLMSCVAHLRKQGKEWRNVRLFGQERNLMTSSIARMNCFLHGIEDFRIERGDTLAEPKLVEGDKLMQFDVVLANPPYSIKQWDREAFRSDPWGRNLFGVPPQGRADYAFQQHINKSLKAKTGRCAVLWPHGVLFRQEEEEIRSKLIEADLIECVIGLGPNLFYNSPMEACVLICRTQKSKNRKGKVLFINAVNEVTRERAQSFLTEEHQSRVLKSYRSDNDIPGLSRHVAISEIRSKNGSLSIPLYFGPSDAACDEPIKSKPDLDSTLAAYLRGSAELKTKLGEIMGGLRLCSSTLSDKEQPPLQGLIDSRSGWVRVRFGDVVQNCSDTGKGAGPAPSKYIGLEHIKPGCLQVQNYGDTADGTTFTKTCKPGQVLFGKRRAYQRKVAVASFDALVSGDIYVMEPKTPTLIADLLPFICMSDRFFEHAVGTSAGSLSPRTNWSSLANYEFDLPPLDQQRRIANVLHNIYRTSVLLSEISKYSESLTSAIREKIALGSFPKKQIKDISLTVASGQSPRWQGFEYQADGPVFVTSENVLFGKYSDSPRKHIPASFHQKIKRSALKKDDVLFNIVGASIGRGCVLPDLGSDANTNQAVVVIRVDQSKALPEFVLGYLLSPTGLRSILKTSVNTARANLSIETIRAVEIPLPDIDTQKVICAEIQKADEIGKFACESSSRLINCIHAILNATKR